MIHLVYAHPYPDRSRAGRALIGAAREVAGVRVHSLYDLYPAFDIDVEAEQRLLTEADVVVLQHPMYWYSVPGLLKHWMDKVLVRGFAYGEGGDALHGRACLWATTTGGDEDAFTADGMHAHPFAAFTPPVEQTARFCGLRWLEPFVLHGARLIDDAHLAAEASRYRARLEALAPAEEGAA